MALQQQSLQIVDRESSVENVFHQNDVQALDAGVEVLGDADLARAPIAQAVAGYGHEIQRHLQRNLPNQIGKENRSAIEHADQVQRLPAKIPRDSPGQLVDAPLDGAAAQQNL